MQDSAVQSEHAVRTRRRVARQLTLDEARDLLDWLEAQHVIQPEIEAEDSGLFTIAWPG